MKITKEYYAFRNNSKAKNPGDHYFFNPYSKNANIQYVFKKPDFLKKCIEDEVELCAHFKMVADISIYSRDVTPWKKYSGSIAGVLPNVQFGIFEQYSGEKNWTFFDSKNVNPKVDALYFENFIDAEIELTAIKDNDKLKPDPRMSYFNFNLQYAVSTKDIFYREVSDWEETII